LNTQKIKLSLVIDNIIFSWIIGIMLKEYGIFRLQAVPFFNGYPLYCVVNINSLSIIFQGLGVFEFSLRALIPIYDDRVCFIIYHFSVIYGGTNNYRTD